MRRQRGATRPDFAGNRNTKVVSAYGIIIGLLPFRKRKDKPEPNSLGIFLFQAEDSGKQYERKIIVQSLIDIFQKTKDVLCKYDYYIYTSKRVLHLTNSELKIPHLMGLQYIGRPNQFTGDFGVYSIKKKRITHDSIEKLVRKYYKTEEKQRIMLEMIYRKLNNLHLLEEMFHSYSKLYLYEKTEGTEFDCDYLMVHESGKAILHLGLVKSVDNKGLYHCNSFMTTYQTDREKDLFFCHLAHRYEINKIVREDKLTKRTETIYQSSDAERRECAGIEKMLAAEGLNADDKLIKAIVKINLKFGKYHLLQELSEQSALLEKCEDKSEEELVKSMGEFLKEAYEQKENKDVTEES